MHAFTKQNDKLQVQTWNLEEKRDSTLDFVFGNNKIVLTIFINYGASEAIIDKITFYIRISIFPLDLQSL